MMNKNEAVQKLSRGALISTAHAEDLYDSFFEKPVVPQYVADWYEEHKDEFYLNLHYLAWDLIENLDENIFLNLKPSELDFRRWYHKNKTALKTLVNMHQFGYEVEKEKRYKVKVKGIAEAYNCLNYNAVQKLYSISTAVESRIYIIKFTRKELEEAGFGEVFDNPMFEIEEVE